MRATPPIGAARPSAPVDLRQQGVGAGKFAIGIRRRRQRFGQQLAHLVQHCPRADAPTQASIATSAAPANSGFIPASSLLHAATADGFDLHLELEQHERATSTRVQTG